VRSLNSLKYQILKILNENKDLSLSSLKRKISIGEIKLKRILDELENEGLVSLRFVLRIRKGSSRFLELENKEKLPRGTYSKIYSLTSKGYKILREIENGK